MSKPSAPTVSVAVVCMSGAQHLTRCLASIGAQRDAPVFDVTVVCDPSVEGIEAVAHRFPDVRMVTNAGQGSPLQLASRALRECTGELILVTKDQCVPSPDWVRTMVDAQAPGRSVVGGRVELAPQATAVDWAFYFIDFYRYTTPADDGSTPSLTLCNVSYQRTRLDAIREIWERAFVETATNDALAARFGGLWLHGASEVTLHRHVGLREGIYERYAFGRVFGCSRIAASSVARRLVYAGLAPALPLVLLWRLMVAALRSRRHAAAFVRSFIPLVLMILARSWGEWLAYVTGRPPRTLKRSL